MTDNNKVILVAETGSDIPFEEAKQLGIYLVPMHVCFDDETLDDGSFPLEKIVEYYDRTGKVPKTSCSTPLDFTEMFEKIHAEHPESEILYIAYSAVTTASYQSAVIASEDLDMKITLFDSAQVSAGQRNVVLEVYKAKCEHPDWDAAQLVKVAENARDKTKMFFVPMNLAFLKAGGRVSNARALIGNLLHIHPIIEIIDGKLQATNKKRGKMEVIIPKLIADFKEKHNLLEDKLTFLHGPGFSDHLKKIAEDTAKALGFKSTEWLTTGCVITCHGGPGAFGIIGMHN